MDSNRVAVMVRFQGEEAARWRELRDLHGGNTNALRHLWRLDDPSVSDSKRKRARIRGISEMFRQCASEGSLTLLTRLFRVSPSGGSMFCRRHNVQIRFDHMARSTPEANRQRLQWHIRFLEKWAAIVAEHPADFPWAIRSSVPTTIEELRKRAGESC